MTKQDILNAFRERFFNNDGLNCPDCNAQNFNEQETEHTQGCTLNNIDNWLLTTLTEFEREIIAKVDNIMDEEKAKDMGDQMEAFTGQRSCKMCGFNPEHQRKYILSQLEKEKRS